MPYKHRRVPPVDGVLTYVSADRLIDKLTERAYYTAQVRIDQASLRALPEVKIIPGMPVEVLIKTGQFTVAHYVLRPVPGQLQSGIPRGLTHESFAARRGRREKYEAFALSTCTVSRRRSRLCVLSFAAPNPSRWASPNGRFQAGETTWRVTAYKPTCFRGRRF